MNWLLIFDPPHHGWIDATGVAAVTFIGGYLAFALLVFFAVRKRIDTLSGLGAVVAICLAMVGFTWTFADPVLQPFVKRSCSLTHSYEDCPRPGSLPCWFTLESHQTSHHPRESLDLPSVNELPSIIQQWFSNKETKAS